MPMPKGMFMTSLLGSGLIGAYLVKKICLHLPVKLWQRLDYFILEMSAQVDTEEQFDKEYDIEAISQSIVDRIKAEVKAESSNKKRHKQ